MEIFIELPGGSTAFITGCKDDNCCEHQWDGDGLITFGNGETFKESEYRKIFETLITEDAVKEWHKGKGTTMGECTCSKCGIPYTSVNNPYYL
jgi:hypothetical protein